MLSARDRLACWLPQLGRLGCSLRRRHDEIMQFEKNRLSLRCVSCGRETPGWVLDRKPIVRFAQQRRLHGPLESVRRVA